jgi:predicted transcriptional regulator
MFLAAMTAEAIIEEIKALSQAEREQVVKFIVEQDDSWIPASFKRGMADAAAGRVVEMESALRETPPPQLR